MKKQRSVRDIASLLANSHWVRYWQQLGYPHYDDRECIQLIDREGRLVVLEGLGESEMIDEGFEFSTRLGITGYHRERPR